MTDRQDATIRRISTDRAVNAGARTFDEIVPHVHEVMEDFGFARDEDFAGRVASSIEDDFADNEDEWESQDD